MRWLILVTALLACGHAPLICPKLMGKPFPRQVDGRAAHICGCKELKDGRAQVVPCYDTPLPSISAPKDPNFKCETMCGLRGQFNEESCFRLNVVESVILELYAEEVTAFRPGYAACAGLSGWTVNIVQSTPSMCGDGAWLDLAEGCVKGLTNWNTKTINVPNAEWESNALAHEIGHVLDYEFGFAKSTHGHCGWHARGLTQAISRVTETGNDPEERCE